MEGGGGVVRGSERGRFFAAPRMTFYGRGGGGEREGGNQWEREGGAEDERNAMVGRRVGDDEAGREERSRPFPTV